MERLIGPNIGPHFKVCNSLRRNQSYDALQCIDLDQQSFQQRQLNALIGVRPLSAQAGVKARLSLSARRKLSMMRTICGWPLYLGSG